MMASEGEAKDGNLIHFSFKGERLQKNNSPKLYCVRFATFSRGSPRFWNLSPGERGAGEIKPSLLEYLRIFLRGSEEMTPFG
jgi:hypothetical protein